ncbi:hypothetical protein Y032_0251g180 [Ancylostoma ceylanicum]|uniref:Uncharacterized protein n=1 Tax=Ancylostoma ceylanicum TaxID=53326 RepID=A0A016SBY7_9BILA|nr:hypothetical protein Y032_0251g180 [Ancylostoma ceylanicum]
MNQNEPAIIAANRNSWRELSKMLLKRTGDVRDSDSGNDAYRLPRPFDYHPSFVWSLPIHFMHVATAGGGGEVWGYS